MVVQQQSAATAWSRITFGPPTSTHPTEPARPEWTKWTLGKAVGAKNWAAVLLMVVLLSGCGDATDVSDGNSPTEGATTIGREPSDQYDVEHVTCAEDPDAAFCPTDVPSAEPQE